MPMLGVNLRLDLFMSLVICCTISSALSGTELTYCRNTKRTKHLPDTVKGSLAV
jgi:hypothetical protein